MFVFTKQEDTPTHTKSLHFALVHPPSASETQSQTHRQTKDQDLTKDRAPVWYCFSNRQAQTAATVRSVTRTLIKSGSWTRKLTCLAFAERKRAKWETMSCLCGFCVVFAKRMHQSESSMVQPPLLAEDPTSPTLPTMLMMMMMTTIVLTQQTHASYKE